MTKDEFINFLQSKFPKFSSVSNTDLKNIFLELLDYINTNLTFDDIIDIPLLQLLKSPVGTMVELKDKYPIGKKGWFAFVVQEKTFAFWDINTKTWDLIKNGTVVDPGSPNEPGNEFSILTLTVNSITDLNRISLVDGIYNIAGALSGTLIVTNTYSSSGTLLYVLQTYFDTNSIQVRKIVISNPQLYPNWKVQLFSNTEVLDSNVFNTDFHVVETNGFNNSTGNIWTDSYEFLLIPGSYGVYFTTPPIPQFLPSKLNFTLRIEYASAKNSGVNSNTDYIQTLIDVETGKEFIRKVYHTSNGLVCTAFMAMQSGGTTTTIGQNGKDGTDNEFIFKMSSSNAAQTTPTTSQSDNYIPEGWSTTLSSTTSSLRYGFMSKRKKVNGIWSSFSTPVIISNFAENGINGINGLNGHNGNNGIDGTDIEFIFKTTATYSPPSTPATSQINDYVPSGWTDNMSGVDITNQYEWVCKRTKATDGTWSNFAPPALWAKWSVDGGGQGEPGVNGVDGKDIEFIFTRTTTLTQPETPASVNVEDYVPVNWTDTMTGVDIINKYEWVSKRYKTGTTWQSFSEPVVWAIYGKDGEDGVNGQDGKSIEFIFKLTTTNTRPSVPTSVDTPDYVPVGWTDNMSGVDSINKYEWASVRTKSGEVWGNFSLPALWSTYAGNGTNGTNAASVLLSKNIINISCLASGDARTGTIPTDIYLHAYDGANLAEITNFTINVENGVAGVTYIYQSKGVIKMTLLSLSTDYAEIVTTTSVFIESIGQSVLIQKTIPVIKIKDGYAGPSIIARGAYNNETLYYGNPSRVDAVSITELGTTQWFITKVTAGEFSGILPQGNGEWEEKWDVMASFEMIATGMLLAENANIAEFIFNGGKLRSQYPLEANNEDKNLILNGVTGELIANNANIRGKVTATSGKIGGLDILGNLLKNGAVTIEDVDIPTLESLKGTPTTITLPQIPSWNNFGYETAWSQRFVITELSLLSFGIETGGDGDGLRVGGYEVRRLIADDPADYDIVYSQRYDPVLGIPVQIIEVSLGEGEYYIYADLRDSGGNSYVELSNISYTTNDVSGGQTQTTLCRGGLYSMQDLTHYLYYNKDKFEVSIGGLKLAIDTSIKLTIAGQTVQLSIGNAGGTSGTINWSVTPE